MTIKTEQACTAANNEKILLEQQSVFKLKIFQLQNPSAMKNNQAIVISYDSKSKFNPP
jgi:hypothetical protein